MDSIIYGDAAHERWEKNVRPVLEGGVKYKLYGRSPDEGFDCIGLLLWAYRECGFALPEPEETGKYPIGYFNRASPVLLLPALHRYATRILPQNLRSGDIIVFENMNWPGHVGIVDGAHFWHVLESRQGAVKELLHVSSWRTRIRCFYRLRDTMLALPSAPN